MAKGTAFARSQMGIPSGEFSFLYWMIAAAAAAAAGGIAYHLLDKYDPFKTGK